jgi:Protein of unknown function (DUF3810)
VKKISFKTILIAFLPIQIIVFARLTNSAEFIEKYYTASLFKNLTLLLRKVTGWFQLSLGLALNNLLVLLIVSYILWLIYNIFKKRIIFKSLFINTLAGFSALYFFYMIFWGMAYHKKPIDTILALNKKEIQLGEIVKLCNKMIFQANQSRNLLSEDRLYNTSFDTVFNQTTSTYNSLAQSNPIFKYQNPSIKKAFMSDALSYLGTSGIYYFWSGEANINTNLYPFEVPYVASHEVAHQLGFASEDEANFVAYLNCKNSKDPLFIYSYSSGIMYKTLWTITESDSLLAKNLYAKINPAIIADREKVRNRWEKYKNPIQKYVFGVIYDLFLKSNGEKDGRLSYEQDIELIIAEERKNGWR